MDKNIDKEHINLDLDDIFDENGYKNIKDKQIYKRNKNVKSIKLTRTKNTPMKIGNYFLSNWMKY